MTMTVEEAAKAVVAALKAQGKSEEQAHAIFAGLYHGKAWESYELYRHIRSTWGSLPSQQGAKP